MYLTVQRDLTYNFVDLTVGNCMEKKNLTARVSVLILIRIILDGIAENRQNIQRAPVSVVTNLRE